MNRANTLLMALVTTTHARSLGHFTSLDTRLSIAPKSLFITIMNTTFEQQGYEWFAYTALQHPEQILADMKFDVLHYCRFLGI